MRSLKSRRLHFESLENREMLAVTAGSEISLPEPAGAVTWEGNTASDVETWDTADNVLSLREALARSSSGDTIIFASSLKNMTISLVKESLTIGKAVTINASSASRITVNAQGVGSVFYVAGDTFTGTVTMINLTITGGFTTGFGGGIENSEGTLVLKNCTIEGNTANFGGGIFNHFGNLTLANCTVHANESSLHGAGLFNHYGTLTLTNTEISENYGYGGGGLYNDNGTTNATGSSFTFNTAQYGGGGVSSFYGTVNLTNCRINDNMGLEGAGIFLNTAAANLVNCEITDNFADGGGGGINNFWGEANLYNCTVAYNAGTCGGGIYVSRSSTTSLYNTICVLNDIYESDPDFYQEEDAVLNNYYSLTSYSGWTSSTRAIKYDASKPLFNNDAILDFTLASDSQAINAGNNVYAKTATDLDGNTRIINAVIDLGAYEFASSPLTPLSSPKILNDSSAQYRVSAGRNRHQIYWSAVSNAKSYEISYSEDGKTWKTLATTNTTLMISGLTYGKTVQYKVRAVGDGVKYTYSDWSAVKSFVVCPIDIDEDGFIGPGDSSILSYCWFTTESDANWEQAADIDGDGFIGPGDRSFLSINWFCTVGEDDIVYPGSSAADLLFGELAD